jgi:hypothetical protein
MRSQRPIYSKLTPSQKEAVSACIHGEEFDIKLEIEFINASITKVTSGPALKFPKWVYGQLLHFYTIRDFLNWVLKEKSDLTIKDISDATEQPATSSARIATVRSITASILAMDREKNTGAGQTSSAIRPHVDADGTSRNRVPKGNAKSGHKSKKLTTQK